MYEPQSIVSKEKSAIISQSLLSGSPAGNLPMEEVIDSRFGKITIRRDNPITFTKGLLGFPGHTQFCLVDFPITRFGQFKLLQSLEENDLSFITLPLDIENPFIDSNDVKGACTELGFTPTDTALLLIVSVHRELRQVKLSANARAPIFIHTRKKQAEQYVLHNNKYLVRHMLTE